MVLVAVVAVFVVVLVVVAAAAATKAAVVIAHSVCIFICGVFMCLLGLPFYRRVTLFRRCPTCLYLGCR